MATASPQTFVLHGRALGLSDERIVAALCRALAAAGPSVGGRFVGPHHLIADDATSLAALDELALEARGRREL